MAAKLNAACLLRSFRKAQLSTQSRVLSARYVGSSSSDQKPLPKKDGPGPGPSQEQLPHVSEEAAAISEITGEQGPEIEQGTPVKDILKRDPSAKEKAPEVLKNKSQSHGSSGSRSFSTSARTSLDLSNYPSDHNLVAHRLDMTSIRDALQPVEEDIQVSGWGGTGHKFGLPDLPIGKHEHLKYRYDPVVQQVTMLMMRDGKLARAQSNMARVLNYLRTAKPPSLVLPSNKASLLPGAPPASHLPLNPILYLTLALDSVAPLLRLRSLKGFAGGGQSLQIPAPLALRQRRRTAVMWIFDAIEKKVARGSGKGMFAQKFAEEIIAIVEGKSGVWDKRAAVHKLGVNARANMTKVLAAQARRKR